LTITASVSTAASYIDVSDGQGFGIIESYHHIHHHLGHLHSLHLLIISNCSSFARSVRGPTATATAESTTTTSRAALAGLVNANGATVEPNDISLEATSCTIVHPLNVVHGGDGSLSIGLLGVADETKATAATSVTILDDDLSDKVG
jgi:hypothetical protein